MTRRTYANIALIGMMGCGKSTIGPLLAERLGFDFVDVDRDIAEAAGRSIPEIFAQDGEDAFRAMESTHTARAVCGSEAVIATGGGVVLRPENRETLRSRCWVVWLKVTPEETVRRVGSGSGRPVLERHGDALSGAQTLLAEREALYAMADRVEDTTGRSPEEIVEALASAWRSARP